MSEANCKITKLETGDNFCDTHNCVHLSEIKQTIQARIENYRNWENHSKELKFRLGYQIQDLEWVVELLGDSEK